MKKKRKKQYETIIIKYINYHINRFNDYKSDKFEIRLDVINTINTIHY